MNPSDANAIPTASRRRRSSASARKASPWGKALACFLILLCFTAMWISYRELRGDISFWELYYSIPRWTESGDLPTHEEVNLGQQQMLQAIAWVPVNPFYRDMLAYLYRMEMRYFPPYSAEYLQLAQRSINESRLALLVRPEWANSYSQIALVKARLFQFDEEWFTYLDRAYQLGPWERDNLAQLTEAGIRGWSRLSESQREVVLTSISRTLRFSPASAVNIRVMMDNTGTAQSICARIQELDLRIAETGQAMPRALCQGLD